MTAQVTGVPAEDKNQEPILELTDEKGNPINEDGTPREVKQDDTELQDRLNSLEQQLKDTKAALTKEQQGKTEDDDDSKEDDKKSDDKTSLEIDQQTKDAEDAGVDLSKYSEEYNKDGGLSDDSYAELAKKGFDKQLVDDYIAGQEARVAKQTTEVASVVGGEEQFNTLKNWAAENLSEAEISAFNESVVKGTESAKLAVQGLNARYVEANGSSPNLIGGETSTNNSGDVFKSPFEMTRAMEDPEYWNNPDHQKAVQAKIERSIKAGKI